MMMVMERVRMKEIVTKKYKEVMKKVTVMEKVRERVLETEKMKERVWKTVKMRVKVLATAREKVMALVKELLNSILGLYKNPVKLLCYFLVQVVFCTLHWTYHQH